MRKIYGAVGAVALTLAVILTEAVAGGVEKPERLYFDACLHSLRGNVRSCVTTRTYNDVKTTLEFRRDGSEVLPDNIVRERFFGGYPYRDIDTDVLPFFSSAPDTTFYAYSDTSITVNRNGRGGTVDYIDADGDVCRTESAALFLGTIVNTYRILERDSHGNWTRRAVYDESGNLIGYEVNVLEYWSDSEEVEAVEENKPEVITFEEPSRELAVEEMMRKPFGVMESPTGSPCDITFDELHKAVLQRSNWECQDYFSDGIIVYGNDNYGERTPKGYNLTYRGEPIFSVNAVPSSDGHLEWFEFSFERGMKGKVPSFLKYDSARILARPQWTESEAVAFADSIASELSRAGVSLSSSKGKDGHFHILSGEDDAAEYVIDVYRHSDKYSAYYMVTFSVRRK